VTCDDEKKRCVAAASSSGNIRKLLRGQLDDDLDVVVWEIPGHSAHAALEPVLVDLTDEVDDFALLEAKFSLVLCLEVVQSLTAWLPSPYINHTTTTRYQIWGEGPIPKTS